MLVLCVAYLVRCQDSWQVDEGMFIGFLQVGVMMVECLQAYQGVGPGSLGPQRNDGKSGAYIMNLSFQ